MYVCTRLLKFVYLSVYVCIYVLSLYNYPAAPLTPPPDLYHHPDFYLAVSANQSPTSGLLPWLQDSQGVQENGRQSTAVSPERERWRRKVQLMDKEVKITCTHKQTLT